MMGDTVNEFRAKALNHHLICDAIINNFLTYYFFKPISGMTEFKDLILDQMMFSKKIYLIEKIFKTPLYNQRIRSYYSNLEINNEKIVAVVNDAGVKLTVTKLIRKMKNVNDIRNHLAHNLVTDFSNLGDIGRVFNRTPANMNFQGDEIKLKNSYDYIIQFFEALKKTT